MNTARSRELFSRALELMPGGVNSPVRAFRSVGGDPLFIRSGKGPNFRDVDGNEYVDYCMSWGPMILGHADEDVVASLLEGVGMGTSFGTPNEYEVELAEMVLRRFPSMDKIRFVNSGTEATMSAIRLARGFTGREKIIKFDGCYHGHADHLLVAGGSGLATFGTPDSAGVNRDNVKDTIVIPFNNLPLLESLLQREGGTIAAVIMEPVPCNYGLIIPNKEFLTGVRELCTRHDILLIWDEVITGLRLAPGGAQEYYGIRADITTLGKIIGGGLPVGAYGASKEIMALVAPDGPVYQAGTLSGNPLAMRAGIATLKKMENLDGYIKLSERGDIFESGVRPVAREYQGRLLFTRLESIFCIYFTGRDRIGDVDQVRESDMKLFALFHRAMLEKGIYLSPSGYEVGFLSTAHGTEEISKTVDALRLSLKEVLG